MRTTACALLIALTSASVRAAAARGAVVGAFSLTLTGVEAGWLPSGTVPVQSDVVTETARPPVAKTEAARDTIGEERDFVLDPPALSATVLSILERQLRMAVQAAPGNPTAHTRMGRFLLARTTGTADPKAKYALASQALLEFERALAQTPDRDGKIRLMASLVRASYMVERYDKTVDYANQWMKQVGVLRPDYGFAQHVGHTALGLVAMTKKDVKGARDQLAMSADHSGSPDLATAGPCMDLAAALVNRGQSDAVSDYLDACGKFWPAGANLIAGWQKTLTDNLRPDFSGHFGF